MKKYILNFSLLIGLLLFGNLRFAAADDSSKPTPKPPHYGDWDITYDKVLKKTTLLHNHRPYGQGVPGMGDVFTVDSFQLEYSFEAVFTGTPGTPTFKVVYSLVFDNPLHKNATFVLANPTRFFKYSDKTQFTLLIDDDSTTVPVENYHTGEFGDAFVGFFPYEEMRVTLSPAILTKLENAKTIGGNLSSDDQVGNKSFSFDNTFKEIVNAFLFRVNEISTGAVVAKH